MFQCLECGRKFKTVKAAEKAANNGCPKCGGVDIDVDAEVCSRAKNPPDADQYARVRKMTPGQIMRAEEEEHRRIEAGYIIGPNGKAICPGVVCRCGEGVRCPAHG